MAPMLRHSGGKGLERSCGAGDWIRSRGPIGGVELLRARFSGRAFARHRHDTYAIGVTEVGVQTFDYRGRVESSRRGQVFVLHPDEAHDGRAGTEGGFGYRIVYVDPARIAAAVRAIRGRPTPLPFVREPVSQSPALARAVTAAFRLPLEPLALTQWFSGWRKACSKGIRTWTLPGRRAGSTTRPSRAPANSWRAGSQSCGRPNSKRSQH